MTTDRRVARRRPPRAPERAASADPEPAEAQEDEPAYASGLQQFTKVVGSVVAPTALASALLYYFGWNHTGWFFAYFGVNSNTLNLSTTDYLIYSMDALFIPLTVGGIIGLLALWAHSLLRGHLRADALSARRLHVLIAALAALGTLMAGSGLVSVVAWSSDSGPTYLAPLVIAAGVLLLAYANHLWRTYGSRAQATRPDPAAVTEWVVVFVLISVSLFWAAADYSGEVGTWRAHRLVRSLPTYPDVVLYSQRDLSLNAPGVQQTRCRDVQAAYSYRYDGLKLILRSGDQYFFLSRGWTKARGVAILLPREPSIRLEFSLAGARRGERPSC